MTTWQDLAMTAVLGTERQAPTLPAPGTPPGALLAGLEPGSAEHRLLASAGTLALYERAGRLPVRDPRPLPPPAEAETLARCSPHAGHHLSVMLGGQYVEVLPEWLAVARAAGRRVPEEYLPALLDLGRPHPEWQEAIRAVAGNRGAWLAARNPDWGYLAGELDEQTWQTGNGPARRILLARLRQTDPAHARDLLCGTWAEESADDRADFLALFTDGLSQADEPFLEAALDDRRKEVRRTAAELLARLPESRLVARMWERLRPLLVLVPAQKGLLGIGPGRKARLEVTLPAACDKEMIRDGVEPKPPSGMGEKAWWLAQMLGAVPPERWSTAWNMRPAEILTAIGGDEWRTVLQQGWIRATRRHRDALWAEALLVVARVKGAEIDPEGLLTILPPDRREAHVLRLIQAAPSNLHDDDSLRDLLWECATPWSLDLSRAVLADSRLYVGKSKTTYDWEFRQSLKRCAPALDPRLAPEAATGWPDVLPAPFWREALDEFLALVQFRAEMRAALAG